jgi:TATA-box binding protein (TBP) (component of TFIID and TFIIIB)
MFEYDRDIMSLEIGNIPDQINVSTMGCSCKLNRTFNLDNIKTSLELSHNDVLTVKVSSEEFRSLVKLKVYKKKIRRGLQDGEKPNKHRDRNTKNYFYNQVTLIIKVNEDPDDPKRINVKLFKNGSIQMSGCKSIFDVNAVLSKMISRFHDDPNFYYINHVEDDKLMINNFKINMINCNYKINIHIDRNKLYNLLISKRIKTLFEPCSRACVIVKKMVKDENENIVKISIFIFEKGNIIITGAKSRDQLVESYEYINTLINDYSDNITKINEDVIRKIIFDTYNELIEEKKTRLSLTRGIKL